MDTCALPFLLTRQSKSQPNFSHEGPGRSSNCLGLAPPHLWSVNSSNPCKKKRAKLNMSIGSTCVRWFYPSKYPDSRLIDYLVEHHVAAEAHTPTPTPICKSRSHEYKGRCLQDTDCNAACVKESESYTGGFCNGRPPFKQCFCVKPCKRERELMLHSGRQASDWLIMCAHAAWQRRLSHVCLGWWVYNKYKRK